MAELAPGQTLDQYEVESVIARGGMATIYRARDRDNGHMVALKVPHMQYASDIAFHERFLREETIGQRLDHPAVIRALRPREKSELYLAMEFVDGELLREHLRRVGALPIPEAVKLAIRIADALVYLHQQGVVHRDLKPENVMLTHDGGVKLMDFGIAHDATLRRMTWSGLSGTMGTPDYMAPEQVQGKGGDERSDVYSLGAILYEMLTGRPPHHGDNVYAAMRAKVNEDPPPPRQLRPEISPALEETVLYALEREPARRPESALELRELLAHPASVMMMNRAARQRAQPRFSRRTQALLMLGGALGAYGLLFWMLAHAR